MSQIYSLVQFSSVAQSCQALCDPMNCSTPGLPVHHQLQEFTQTHIHRVSDAIQPSHPLYQRCTFNIVHLTNHLILVYISKVSSNNLSSLHQSLSILFFSLTYDLMKNKILGFSSFICWKFSFKQCYIFSKKYLMHLYLIPDILHANMYFLPS